jgi:hypothetical protein
MKAISIVALAFVVTLWSYFLYKGCSGQSLGNDLIGDCLVLSIIAMAISGIRKNKILPAIAAVLVCSMLLMHLSGFVCQGKNKRGCVPIKLLEPAYFRSFLSRFESLRAVHVRAKDPRS